MLYARIEIIEMELNCDSLVCFYSVYGNHDILIALPRISEYRWFRWTLEEILMKISSFLAEILIVTCTTTLSHILYRPNCVSECHPSVPIICFYFNESNAVSWRCTGLILMSKILLYRRIDSMSILPIFTSL